MLLEAQKILITGPAGQIAFPLARRLAAANEVWGIARFSDPASRERACSTLRERIRVGRARRAQVAEAVVLRELRGGGPEVVAELERFEGFPAIGSGAMTVLGRGSKKNGTEKRSPPADSTRWSVARTRPPVQRANSPPKLTTNPSPGGSPSRIIHSVCGTPPEIGL